MADTLIKDQDAIVTEVSHNYSLVFLAISQGDIYDIVELSPADAEVLARRLLAAVTEVRQVRTPTADA